MTDTITPATVWAAYEEDGEGHLYASREVAQAGAIALYEDFMRRENPDEPIGEYSWHTMKHGDLELLDGRNHTGIYVSERPVHAEPVSYTVRECGCPARFEEHAWGCKHDARPVPVADGAFR